MAEPSWDETKPVALASNEPTWEATSPAPDGTKLPPAENPHDLVPFLKAQGSGLLDLGKSAAQGVAHAVAHPVDTAGELAHYAGDVLSDPVGDVKGALRAVRHTPLLGTAVDDSMKDLSGLGALVTGGDDQKAVADYEKTQAREDAAHAKAHPLTDFVQKSAGLAVLPEGIAAQASAMAVDAFQRSLAEGNDPLTAMKDARNTALLMGSMSAAGKGALKGAGMAGRAVAKEAGVSPEVMARYRANPAAVNAAKPLLDTTKDFLADTDARQTSMSQQSSDSFATLKDAGTTTPENITQPIQAQIDRLRSLGVFGPERKAAIGFLNSILDDVHSGSNIPGSDLGDAVADFTRSEAPNTGPAAEPLPKEIGLDKGKAVLNALDSQYEKLSSNPGADPQVLKAIGDARSGIDGYLKQTVPAYGTQMETLAAQAKDYGGLAEKFRTDSGAMNTLKRIQTGKDPFAAEALQKYDQQFGTTYGEDLQNSAAKQAFEKSTTNGSRKVQAGKGVGGAVGATVGGFVAGPVGAVVGGHIGAAAGGVAGGLADTYGGQAVKAALDAGIKIDRLQGTKYIHPLMEAAKLGPQPLAVAHFVMAQQNPDYQKLLEEGGDDRPPPHMPAE